MQFRINGSLSYHIYQCILIFQITLNNVKSSIKEFTKRTNPDLSITVAVLYFSLNYLERSAVVSYCLDRYGNEQKSGMCLSGWEWRSGDVIGVMTWEIKFALIFWHRRGLCTIKTPCKFHSLKPPPHYKQSIYLMKLQKQLVWIWGARWHHRGTNICINIASRARHRQIVIFSP